MHIKPEKLKGVKKQTENIIIMHTIMQKGWTGSIILHHKKLIPLFEM